jgi:hypothetical protein
VPQNRHGAFDHLISSDPPPPGTGCAGCGTAMPAACGGDGGGLRLQQFASRE